MNSVEMWEYVDKLKSERDEAIKTINFMTQTNMDICSKIRCSVKHDGKAYNPFDEGWNMALRFALDKIERHPQNCSEQPSRDRDTV